VTAPLRPDLEIALSAVQLPLGMGKAIEYANQMLGPSETVAFACCGVSRGRTRKVLVVTSRRVIGAGRELGLVESWSIDRGAITEVSIAVRGAQATVAIDTRAGCFVIRAGSREGEALAAALR
jgi:hypothetical protein